MPSNPSRSSTDQRSGAFLLPPDADRVTAHEPVGRRHKERRTSDSGSRFEARAGLTRHKNDGDY
jgi:hypothetical protein